MISRKRNRQNSFARTIRVSYPCKGRSDWVTFCPDFPDFPGSVLALFSFSSRFCWFFFSKCVNANSLRFFRGCLNSEIVALRILILRSTRFSNRENWQEKKKKLSDKNGSNTLDKWNDFPRQVSPKSAIRGAHAYVFTYADLTSFCFLLSDVCTCVLLYTICFVCLFFFVFF